MGLVKLLVFLIKCSRNIRYSRTITVLVVVTGVISGISNTALLAVINSAFAAAATQRQKLIWIFLGLCIVLPISRLISEVLLIRLTSAATFDLRMQLSSRILASPLRLLEQMGAPRLLAILTDDIPTITNALVNIPILCMHMAIVVGSLIYLASLSKQLLIAVIIFMVIGVITYQLPVMKGMRYFKKAREEWDILFKHFRALIEGTKELKLHSRRRAQFLQDQLSPSADQMRRQNNLGSYYYSGANCWGQALFFLLIGLVIFVGPAYKETDPQTLSGYTLALLYLMTPLQVILSLLPSFGHAAVAVEKVNQLGATLKTQTLEESATVIEEPRPRWQRLELVDVAHSYHNEAENSSFTVGPINLTFTPGELVFLIGGNGSGKTTFAKLLTGLYTPESGEIYLDGQRVTAENREYYCQFFSVVFSDFYLFETLLGLDDQHLSAKARDYLIQLQLSHKVEVKEGVLSTTDLSTGQRKRLALLTACLENRPIYVFDEWAADQDPLFKEVFYRQILPELRHRGKTVLVITHDDRYYNTADHIIKLDYGKLEFQKQVSHAEGASIKTPAARGV
ncbi:MAG: cyclic peptide export ABC transporter [Blastocatellia bacterium]